MCPLCVALAPACGPRRVAPRPDFLIGRALASLDALRNSDRFLRSRFLSSGVSRGLLACCIPLCTPCATTNVTHYYSSSHSFERIQQHSYRAAKQLLPGRPPKLIHTLTPSSRHLTHRDAVTWCARPSKASGCRPSPTAQHPAVLALMRGRMPNAACPGPAHAASSATHPPLAIRHPGVGAHSGAPDLPAHLVR